MYTYVYGQWQINAMKISIQGVVGLNPNIRVLHDIVKSFYHGFLLGFERNGWVEPPLWGSPENITLNRLPSHRLDRVQLWL